MRIYSEDCCEVTQKERKSCRVGSEANRGYEVTQGEKKCMVALSNEANVT